MFRTKCTKLMAILMAFLLICGLSGAVSAAEQDGKDNLFVNSEFEVSASSVKGWSFSQSIENYRFGKAEINGVVTGTVTILTHAAMVGPVQRITPNAKGAFFYSFWYKSEADEHARIYINEYASGETSSKVQNIIRLSSTSNEWKYYEGIYYLTQEGANEVSFEFRNMAGTTGNTVSFALPFATTTISNYFVNSSFDNAFGGGSFPATGVLGKQIAGWTYYGYKGEGTGTYPVACELKPISAIAGLKDQVVNPNGYAFGTNVNFYATYKAYTGTAALVSDCIPVVPGETINFSVWCASNGKYHSQCYAYESETNNIDLQVRPTETAQFNQNINQSSEWKKVEMSYTITGATTKFVRIGFVVKPNAMDGATYPVYFAEPYLKATNEAYGPSVVNGSFNTNDMSAWGTSNATITYNAEGYAVLNHSEATSGYYRIKTKDLTPNQYYKVSFKCKNVNPTEESNPKLNVYSASDFVQMDVDDDNRKSFCGSANSYRTVNGDWTTFTGYIKLCGTRIRNGVNYSAKNFYFEFKPSASTDWAIDDITVTPVTGSNAFHLTQNGTLTNIIDGTLVGAAPAPITVSFDDYKFAAGKTVYVACYSTNAAGDRVLTSIRAAAPSAMHTVLENINLPQGTTEVGLYAWDGQHVSASSLHKTIQTYPVAAE